MGVLILFSHSSYELWNHSDVLIQKRPLIITWNICHYSISSSFSHSSPLFSGSVWIKGRFLIKHFIWPISICFNYQDKLFRVQDLWSFSNLLCFKIISISNLRITDLSSCGLRLECGGQIAYSILLKLFLLGEITSEKFWKGVVTRGYMPSLCMMF